MKYELVHMLKIDMTKKLFDPSLYILCHAWLLLKLLLRTMYIVLFVLFVLIEVIVSCPWIISASFDELSAILKKLVQEQHFFSFSSPLLGNLKREIRF